MVALDPQDNNFGDQRSESRNLYDFEIEFVPSGCLSYYLANSRDCLFESRVGGSSSA